MASAEKKAPIRKCMGCGEHFPKGELIRIVRTPDGQIILDFVGKANGRGAYICKSAACLKKARRAGRAERELNCSIPSEVYERLETELSQ